MTGGAAVESGASRLRAADVPTSAELLAVVAAGLDAPSGDNCQPWSVDLRDDGFDLWFEPARGASVFDAGHVASWLGAGAFVENAALRAAELGLALAATPLPEPGEPHLFVRATLTRAPGLVADELAACIARRHCQRGPYAVEPLAPELAQRLAMTEGPAQVRVLAERVGLDELAGLVEVGERARAAWREAHLALGKWLRFSPAAAARTRDGLDVRTLGLGAGERLALRVMKPWPVMRLSLSLGGESAMGRYARRIAAQSGAVCLVTSRDLAPAGLLAAGRALERTWLRATAAGLQASPLGALTLFLLSVARGGAQTMPARHQPRLRAAGARLRELFGLDAGEEPLLLLRAGHGPPPAVVSLRRPVAEVLRTQERRRVH